MFLLNIFKASKLKKEVEKLEKQVNDLNTQVTDLNTQNEKLSKNIASQTRKLDKIKEIYKSAEYSINNFTNKDYNYQDCKLPSNLADELDLISPSITLQLHCMDVKSLRKEYQKNQKDIDKLLERYSSKYTTKANKSIYSLMVIALRCELQNIIYNLKYEKLDKAIDDVKEMSNKYLEVAANGNQSIAGTLTKFIGEVEYLFIKAVEIEYNYYVKKEQAKQEQLAIKEQMRQEAEERKALEAERKKIEKEESKYVTQIEAVNEQMKNANPSELAILEARIKELQEQLSSVKNKKDDIINLQNGKAGNVYIISNLGSFGENVFKIGMTRRLDPQDRVNELGNASVPFRFDVHSFIFSDDASTLETELHKRLNNKRINKVNLRKEFFNVSIDELEALVAEICPSAEFKKTMIAEEFRQSLSTDGIYTSDFVPYTDENDD